MRACVRAHVSTRRYLMSIELKIWSRIGPSAKLYASLHLCVYVCMCVCVCVCARARARVCEYPCMYA